MLCLALLALVCTGCGRFAAPVIPPTGGAYTNIRGPLDLESREGKSIGAKKGIATTTAWLGLWSTGDSSIEAAARLGGIDRIDHIDYEYRNLLWGLKSSFSTVVYGE